MEKAFGPENATSSIRIHDLTSDLKGLEIKKINFVSSWVLVQSTVDRSYTVNMF